MLNKLILEKFNNNSPVGEDCKYQDSFLFIEQEVDKSYSVTQDGSTDWKLIIKKSEDFLINESKDLKIASWWLYGLWREESWLGLKNGLYTYNELLKIFKKDLFPKSKKAKTNILHWLNEILSEEFNNNDALEKLIIDEEEIKNLLEELDLIIKEILENNEDNFKKIIRFINNKITEKNSKIPDIKVVKKEEITKNDTQIIKKDEIEKITEINSDADAINILRTFKKNASLLCNYYRKNSISDLKALRITRLLSWLDTEGLPYADGKKTFLNPPSELELDDLENLYKNNSYEEALYLAEEIVEVSPFWLDGHLYVFNILEKTKNFPAAMEVKNTFINFIKTNEGILDFTFMDGRPFASGKTKKWIERELNSNKSNSKESTVVNDQEESSFKKIYDLANDGNIFDAMYAMEEKFNTSKNIEEKFNWRLKHAQLAIEFEEKNIALALLEELEKDVKKYHLNEWNPKLASEVYNLLLTSFSNIDIPSDKLEDLYKNLCKTDISSAIKIKLN